MSAGSLGSREASQIEDKRYLSPETALRLPFSRGDELLDRGTVELCHTPALGRADPLTVNGVP